VQLGASYPIAQASTKLFDQGCQAVAKYIHARPDEVVIGPSTTQLFRNLSVSLYDYITPDSEIIVSKLDHEANIASWISLAKDKNAVLKFYEPSDKTNPQIEPEELQKLLTPKTKLFACTHTSNILGTINNIKALASTVHTIPGALFCVDAVAYAPHRAIDVTEWGVDFYSFSWYKVYGPHIACLYASRSAQKCLRTLGHFFHPTDTLENLLGLAAANYELTASIPEVVDYLADMPWESIAGHEEMLQGVLIDWLLEKGEKVQIWGEPVKDKAKRVPVVSWTVKGRSSRQVVEAVEAKSEFGFRWGAFYSNRLVEEVLGLDPVDGVIRVSLVHYNTEEEVREFTRVFDEVIFASSS
jgi:selenocysteine lyase/cysteine desulfurase